MRKLPNIHPGEVLLEEFLEKARKRLEGTLPSLETLAA
jgi:hypothetical protein